MAVDNRSSDPVFIKKMELRDNHDIKKISQNLSLNRILFVQTKLYFEQHRDDIIVLRDTMNQLKKICTQNGGSMGRIGEDILVLTPNENVKLF